MRRCEILDRTCRLFRATHLTNLWCVAVKLSIELADCFGRRTLQLQPVHHPVFVFVDAVSTADSNS
ncbi:hypothetical protein QUA13_16435 [Microcoleus sp. S28C3]|uniref:hypothetical protein n=1 Tax=Microcoleus sp. S28C3 TaxID=3055414 RepID=UPI002FD20F9E